MNKVDEKKIKDVIHTIGLNNYLVDSEIKKIVESQFRFTYDTIRNLPVEEKTDEELDKLKTNFTYKYLGKLYTSSDIIRRQQLKNNILKQKKNEQEEFKSNRSIGIDEEFSGDTII